MTHELFAMLCRSTLAATVALTIVLIARVPSRRWLGAHAAYRLWLLVPVAAVATLLPAPVRPLAVAQSVAPSLQVPTTTIDLNATIAATPFDAQPWLLTVWIIGACALLLWFVLQQRRYLRNLGALVDMDAGMLRAQTSVGSPALVGALRPRIVLPSDFESRYTQRERELVLVHERVHLRRGDAQINALVALLRCLNWFNPLFHLAASRFRFDQELACDALVVARFPEARRCYADAMLKAQLAGQARQELRLPAGCYWPSSHPLKERIAMLKFPEPSKNRRAVAAATIAALTLGMGYASWAAQPAQQASSPSTSSVMTSAIGNVNAWVTTDLVLTVDGHKLDASWTSQTKDTQFMQHDARSDATSARWTIASLPGKPFSLDVFKGNEHWGLVTTAAPLADGTFDFTSVVEHNGTIVGQPRLVVREAEPAAIQIGDDLGSAGPPQIENPSDLITLSVRANGQFYWNGESVSEDQLQQMLTVTSKKTPQPELQIQADKTAEYELVATAMADAKTAGIRKIGFLPARGASQGGFKGFRVDFTLARADATGATSSNTKEQAAASASDYTEPSESITFRRMHPPKYPPEAVKAHVQGEVNLKVHIDSDGVPIAAEVASINPPSAVELGSAAVATAMSWRYNPATRNGVPVDGYLSVPVAFKLSGKDGTPEPAADPARALPVTYRKMSPPPYPEHAIANKLSGTVYTRLQIAADGSVTNGRVEQVVPASAVELGDAALAAVKTWTFNPQTVNGMAIPGDVRVPVQFKLNGYIPTKAAQAAPALPLAHTLEMVTITGPAR